MRNGLEGELLRLLRDAGPQTKSQLAQTLGVPRTTVSASLRSLADAGHIEDGPLAASSGGRRSVNIRIAPGRLVVAVTLSERRARVAVLDGHLTIATSASIDLQDREPDPERLSGTVLEVTEQVLAGSAPATIGVATVDTESGLNEAVVGRFADVYAGTPVATLPAVRAMALGERRSGAARGVDDFVAVRLGGSVTTTTVAGGRLGLGASGRSGEIGHLRVEEFGPACVCGLTGCLDSFVSPGALVAQATDLVRRGRSPALGQVIDRRGAIEFDDLVAAARAGDPVVALLARDLGQRLGKVVAGLVAQADPRCVVLGGPVTALGRHLMGDLRATVYRLAPPRVAEDLEIVMSVLGLQGVLIGAASTALDLWIDREIGLP